MRDLAEFEGVPLANEDFTKKYRLAIKQIKEIVEKEKINKTYSKIEDILKKIMELE